MYPAKVLLCWISTLVVNTQALALPATLIAPRQTGLGSAEYNMTCPDATYTAEYQNSVFEYAKAHSIAGTQVTGARDKLTFPANITGQKHWPFCEPKSETHAYILWPMLANLEMFNHSYTAGNDFVAYIKTDADSESYAYCGAVHRIPPTLYIKQCNATF